jgi:hypothetical protein
VRTERFEAQTGEKMADAVWFCWKMEIGIRCRVAIAFRAAFWYIEHGCSGSHAAGVRPEKVGGTSGNETARNDNVRGRRRYADFHQKCHAAIFNRRLDSPGHGDPLQHFIGPVMIIQQFVTQLDIPAAPGAAGMPR